MSEQPPRPSLTVAEAVAAALQRHGVTVIFGQSLPSALMLAAPKFGIRQLAYRTENAAGTMADGYARVSNTISVVAAQNGPAATLLVPPWLRRRRHLFRFWRLYRTFLAATATVTPSRNSTTPTSSAHARSGCGSSMIRPA